MIKRTIHINIHKMGDPIWIGFVFLQIFFGCARKTEELSQPLVLARIGSETITAQDFRYRAGLTVRPGSIRTVNAVLNNLIAEKLLANEAGDTCELAKNPAFQAFVQGIREQAMREQLYHEIALKQVRLSEDEIKKTYDLSQKVYDLDFFTINNPEIVEQVQLQLSTGQSTVSEIFSSLKALGESGQQTVKWRDPDNDQIHKALFNREHDIGEIIGPIRFDMGRWMMMRVLDSRTEPMIGPEEFKMRIHEVRKKLTELKARDIWHNYKNTMMQGKEIRFEKAIFEKIVELFLEERQSSQDQEIPPPQKSEPDTHLVSQIPDKLDAMLDQPFFRLDGETWTVGDFKRAIMSHPLVYRKKMHPNDRFPSYFKQAIADLIVDHYLNKEAYRRGLNKHPEVQRQGQQWKDCYLAKKQINQYLKKIQVHELQKKDHTYYGPRAVNEYLAQLNQKYSGHIHINKENLKELDLNKTVPVFVMRPGMPYPVAIPPFPHFTNTDSLLFGRESQDAIGSL